jgi:hypothetical protein
LRSPRRNLGSWIVRKRSSKHRPNASRVSGDMGKPGTAESV